MKNAEVVEMFREFSELAGLTATSNWDSESGLWAPDHNGAKAIGFRQWQDALRVARVIALEVPNAPRPIPEAHPGGFVGLVYEKGERSFDLHLSASLDSALASWTARYDGEDHKFTSNTLRPIIESMRTTFRE